MLDADRPITSSIEDKLNRTVFAKYLARCMLDHNEPDSLVVGLYGGWGVGKTSVINLVMEELNFAASNMEDNTKPIILNFSAWSYSGQHQLIYSFFRRLSSALRGVTYLENSERILHLLELYVSFFTHQPVPRSLRPKRPWYEKLIKRRNEEEVYAWESGRDLTLVKAELNELLRHQQHKIIISIDNISRLYPDEIKQLFQIVKSMGDYANTVYLLAFDKDQVITALDNLDEGGGEDFVEKVIQMPFEIPAIQQQDLEIIFADKLSDLMTLVPNEAWNTEYWADIYYNSLKYFFLNCRDITRYVNTLEFSYTRLRDVVNPVDFFALTALEVFTPEVYAGIRDNKDLFTDLLDNVYIITEDQREKDKARCEEIIHRTNRIDDETLLELLIYLFPRLSYIYYPDIKIYHAEAMARKLRRICSPDLFDIYFRLSMQTSQIPLTEFYTLLDFASDEAMFEQVITRLNQDERIIKFLDLLDSKIIKKIPKNHIQTIVNALLENGDLFPAGVTGKLSLETPMRIHRIIHDLLRRFPNSEDRYLLLQQAIGKAVKSVYISVFELREQAKEHSAETDSFIPSEYRDLEYDQLKSLQQLAVSKIIVWAENGSLVDHPKLLPLLYAWRDWGDADACSRYVKQITHTDHGLFVFLNAILGRDIDLVMLRQHKDSHSAEYLEKTTLFLPPHELTARAKAIFENDAFETLSERDQLAILLFLDITQTQTSKTFPNISV